MPGYSRMNVLSWCPSRPAKRYDLHGSLTFGALEDRPGSCCTGFNQDLQNHLDQRQQLFGVAMQKPIVSDAAKAFWQNVLQNHPQKVFAIERTIVGFTGTAIDIFKSNAAVLIGDDIIFRNHASV